MNLRCSAYRCDNVVSVTDDEMSDPAWRRYMVHCPEHQLTKGRRGSGVSDPNDGSAGHVRDYLNDLKGG